jgi:hypothetical protein
MTIDGGCICRAIEALLAIALIFGIFVTLAGAIATCST